MPLPVRFRKFEELTERQKEARLQNYHCVNLTGKDLKPLLRDRFRPVLKALGFSRVSDSLSVRTVEPHYVHCLRLDFSPVHLGRLFVRAGIALDFLPLSDWTAFTPKRLRVDSDCLLIKDVTLPNGNPEFDNGTNLEEAHETIRYLISCFEDFDSRYFGRFTHFPAPLDALDEGFVRGLAASMRSNSESEYGVCGATIAMFTLRLALVHQFLGNTATCRKLAEYGLANFELFDLKRRYEQLVRE